MDLTPPGLLASAVHVVRNPSGRVVARGANQNEARRSEVGILDQPRVVLQVRSGAGGGNPNRINMIGEASIYVDRRANESIDFDPDVGSDEDSVAFCDGGYIPVGFEFVVSRIEYRGVAAGDSNGSGGFVVRVGSDTIVRVQDSAVVESAVWEGEILIRAGEEAAVFLEVANSSAGEAVIEGWIRPSSDQL